jgi:BolA protein
MGPVERAIHDKLQALAPETLELADESGQHVGHEGARSGGGHYRLFIVSNGFRGKSRLERHRMVYAALGELMRGPIHALALEAFAPDER